MSDQPAIDHRQLGRELGLFASDDLFGAGLPMWLPAGAAIRAEIERYVVDLERRAGYHHVYTPPLAKRGLYEKSGHWQHFRDDMFPCMEMGGDEVVLRPMNCPHHMRLFAVGEHSYRDLPLRIAELGAMFRNERSGVLGGLSRVRAMTLNDGHVFCRPEQVEDEVRQILELMTEAHRVLGVDVHRLRLSLRGPSGKYADDEAAWKFAERALRNVLDAAGVDYEPEEGEAAFYGPKLDVQVLDGAGREETLSTVQVDVVLPKRLGLAFVGDDGQDHSPVVVHRSIVSTMERMVAYLVERHRGLLPTWLSPVQLAVLPVTDEWDAAAREVAQLARDAGLRVELADARQTLNARIRAASVARVPYVAVIGGREAAANAVSARGRSGDLGTPDAREFVAALTAEVRERRP